ncbi:MAG TPA: hypothetical protein VLF71_00710 [Candidatus Saccharimonadales bacterium]|nr:hypothetical protein [Candidatus Saccharimonadales bacterium]
MLTIIRDSGYADRLRKYKVVLDGIVVGDISNGETKSFDIAAGKHSLQLKVDWAKSNLLECTYKPGEDLKFTVTSPLRGINVVKSVFYATIFSNKYLKLEQIT